MQCLKIDDLRNATLPSSLPAGTEMGVWKRSTGFEVVLPFRRGGLYWFKHGFMFVLLSLLAGAIIFTMLERFPNQGVIATIVLFAVVLAPLLAYLIYIFMKIAETRASKIRIDMSAISLKLLRIYPSGQTRNLNKIPIHHIEEVWIDESRGLRIDGTFTAGVWLARGLGADDLYYLALLIGQVTTLPVPKVYTIDEYS